MNSIAFILDGHCSVDIFFFFFLGCFWTAPFINMYIYIYILSISFSYVPLIFPIYIYIYIYIYILSISFSYVPLIFPTLNMLPPYPTPLNVHHLVLGPIIFKKKLWLHVTPPIFTAILTCSTIKTIPFRFSKKNKENTKDFLY